MLDDTIDAIKIYGHFISIYLIKLFIYFILLYLYVIRNKFACINFYISFFLYRDEDGKREEKFERTSDLKRRDKTNNWIRIEIGTKEERLHRVKRRNNRVLLLFSRIMSRLFRLFRRSVRGTYELARDQQLSRTPFVSPLFIRFFFRDTPFQLHRIHPPWAAFVH